MAPKNKIHMISLSPPREKEEGQRELGFLDSVSSCRVVPANLPVPTADLSQLQQDWKVVS